ncbi:MAG: chemotaxis protein CheC [Candidatus Latescibacteria bacterium]|nr:chemotaxis protein CheC [Candidatus Latescibacterota bacterium]MCK5327032.1 chemotaxis protein CheC [Candidatus Latescibacterota bacterium]MCK5381324.1 chemotaxis protein CheC [Candidatus Latescibacterota bacterium]
MENLTPAQMDGLAEVINIGVGRAASFLNDVIDAHITLEVPRVRLLPFEKLPQIGSEFGDDLVSCVVQTFQADYTGTAALVFPPESAARLVSAVTGEEITSAGLDAVRSGVLTEVGNIVINAILGTMGNLLQTSLEFSLPEYRQIRIIEFMSPKSVDNQNGFIILAEASFEIETLRINSYLLLIFELTSIDLLMSMIDNVTSDALPS